MSDLSTATVFVTGATSGFGAATARRFAKDGARLVLCGRRSDRLAAMKAELPVPVLPLILDVRNRNAVAQAFASLPADFAKIDVLVNNAGLALGLEKAPEANLDDWETMIDTNVKGVVYCTRAVLPGMVERRRGHIINISSVACSYPYSGGNVYGATKSFVTTFSLNLKAELLGTPVRVTNIEPGLCETEFSLVRFKGDAQRASSAYADAVPLTADDIAECIRWAAALPPDVNINRIEVMPLCQGPERLATYRGKVLP